MKDDLPENLHRHLDGEIPRDELDAEARHEADQWERMVVSFRTAAPRGAAPPWLEQRVMAEIASVPERGALARAIDWLVSPTAVRVRPLTLGLGTGLVTAALALLLPSDAALIDEGAVIDGAEGVVYVQFVLEAPRATSVAVAGDFNGWEPSFALEDPDGDGVWSARVPVRPGVHAYMFLIDDTSWQTDPNAGRYQDDGFGNRNAVLAVGASG